jgi:hypothetical protein
MLTVKGKRKRKYPSAVDPIKVVAMLMYSSNDS